LLDVLDEAVICLSNRQIEILLKNATALFGLKIMILFVPIDQPMAKFLNSLLDYSIWPS
jgi:hypothetical protein